MDKIILTKKQARRFLLLHQGLWPPQNLKDKSGILAYIQRVGSIQFDPLDIVGRNPELVLQARISDFRSSILHELLYADRKLLDGLDKNMCIYSVQDWPYFHRRREGARRYYGKSSRPATTILPQVRKAIEERGPLSSIDLDFNETVDWSWAPTRQSRAALESMYSWGELIIHHKIHTRKVYDFAHRHIAQDLLSAPDPNKSEEQYHDWYVLRRIGSIGLMWDKAGNAWLGMPIKSNDRKAAFKRLLDQGKITEVSIEDVDSPIYLRSEERTTLEKALHSNTRSRRAVILAPLDNLLWDRRFIEILFNFSYVWEVYKPVAERRYGYYVLPVLFGDRFIARFEPGREKESGALIIKNWWWEEGITPSERMQAALRFCFKHFLDFLGTDQFRIDQEAIGNAGIDWLNPRT
jgi:uncharacterized protein YcaQ